VTLSLDVARDFLERHPEGAAPILERIDPREAAAVLLCVPLQTAARVLEYVTAVPAAAILSQFDSKQSALVIDLLPVEVALRYLRRLTTPIDDVLQQLPASKSQMLRPSLGYPEHTAGALLDPQVLALAEELSIREAVERVRTSAGHARYNLYVVDRTDRLVGVLNLRELLLALPDQQIGRIASRNVMHLRADADTSAIVSHPGWRKVHALPVVDDAGCYMGAIRYVRLRRLQDELAARSDNGAQTSQALGEVFSVGLSGILDLFSGPENR